MTFEQLISDSMSQKPHFMLVVGDFDLTTSKDSNVDATSSCDLSQLICKQASK